MNDSRVTNAGINQLKGLTELRYLNVKGTGVSAVGLKNLAGLKKLAVIYTFNSALIAGELVDLKKSFPKTRIDTGNYNLPKLASDTTEITKALPN